MHHHFQLFNNYDMGDKQNRTRTAFQLLSLRFWMGRCRYYLEFVVNGLASSHQQNRFLKYRTCPLNTSKNMSATYCRQDGNEAYLGN